MFDVVQKSGEWCRFAKPQKETHVPARFLIEMIDDVL